MWNRHQKADIRSKKGVKEDLNINLSQTGISYKNAIALITNMNENIFNYKTTLSLLNNNSIEPRDKKTLDTIQTKLKEITPLQEAIYVCSMIQANTNALVKKGKESTSLLASLPQDLLNSIYRYILAPHQLKYSYDRIKERNIFTLFKTPENTPPKKSTSAIEQAKTIRLN